MTTTLPRLTRGMVGVLAVICTGHALVDAASISTLLRAAKLGDAPMIYLIYITLAFGLQGPIGYIVDWTGISRNAAWIGALVTTLGALLLPINPYVAIFIVGIGNSLYHVGAGTMALQLEPGRARSIGIFVSTGAIGVTTGVLVGLSATAPVWPILALLVALVAFLWPLRGTKHALPPVPAPHVAKPLIMLAVFLLGYAILIRSLLQLSVGFPLWKTTLLATWLITAVVVLGKAIGGAVADKYGWARVSSIALLLSMPLMLYGRGFEVLALAGVFLFNIPMSVTLVGIARAFPKYPAAAFGLTPTFLFFGAIPAFTLMRGVFITNIPGVLATASAIIAIVAGVAIMQHESHSAHTS